MNNQPAAPSVLKAVRALDLRNPTVHPQLESALPSAHHHQRYPAATPHLSMAPQSPLHPRAHEAKNLILLPLHHLRPTAHLQPTAIDLLQLAL